MICYIIACKILLNLPVLPGRKHFRAL
uniref:Uncharacterized protein n=1 Tax=Anguilla anguilla TaxID=7936 RepID=A0A0E9SLP0_ANGAN